MDARPIPSLSLLCTIECEVDEIVSLGQAPAGERRFVPLGHGRVSGPVLDGELIEGGVDWQWRRADGALEIDAHYALRLADGAVVEVRSVGLRHGPPEVMAALARGDEVPPSAYYFRTAVRFTTGAPAWLHLNDMLALAVGGREKRRVLLDLYAIG
jgi:hypothetical protein